ncbi:MAG: hypothetical protein WBN40_10255 [Pseudomonadales bacterium]
MQTISPVDGTVYVERESASKATINTARENTPRKGAAEKGVQYCLF